MQLSFDPLNPTERNAVAEFLARVSTDERIDTPPVTAMAAAGLGTDADRPDERDAASVFGAASASATPLPLPALSTVGAGQLPTAPVVQPVTFQTALPGVSLPASVAQQPAAPTASAQANSLAAGVELDTDGLPWDGRIHGSTKSRNADGRWRAKKGLNDAALVQRVQAELRAVQGLPAPSSAAPLPGLAAAPMPALPAVTTPAVGTLPLPLPLPAGLPVATVEPANFDEMMPRITAAVTAGAMPQDALLAAVQAHQLPSIVTLTARPDYVVHIWKYLKQQYPSLV